jgi:hypothetical protein
MSWYRPEPEPKITLEQAKTLLTPIREELFPGVLGDETNLFERRKCEHCNGLHTKKCPAVREIEFHVDGKVKRVVYFNNEEWHDDEIIWLDDVYEALATEEAYGQQES